MQARQIPSEVWAGDAEMEHGCVTGSAGRTRALRQRVRTERIQEIINPVRWERNSKTGLLDVTPVGVVDIDPACGVVCPPIDID
jgi:hypothetical protein